MDKITQALSKFLPAEQVSEVSKALEAALQEHYSQVESEFQTKLDQVYEQLTNERAADEKIAEAGYEQAYEIISSLMNRIDEQKNEFEATIEEGFEEAYAEIEALRKEKDNIEVALYEDFDKKLGEMKNVFIEKLDQFAELQNAEIYEMAKKDVLSDPRVLEHKIAIEKIIDILSDYVSNEDIAGVSSSKIEESHRQIDALRGQIRLLESKNVKLSVTNNKLSEQVSQARQYVTEATKIERTNRVNKKGTVSGRGQRVGGEQLISEFTAPAEKNVGEDKVLAEGANPLSDVLTLAGL